MAKDPAFLFYPGDYLRDTQTLSEKTQVAYDRIMCEHMRNICISERQLKFFTKRLSDDEIDELKFVLTKVNGGYQIEWVAESIVKRRKYSESRSKNRTSNSKNTSKTYDYHMENEDEDEDESKSDNETEILINYSFEDFWNLYDKKVGVKSKMKKKWESFTDDKRHLIMVYIEDYKKAQPEKRFRKDPQTFFNQESWNDELINNNNGQQDSQTQRIADKIINQG